MITTAYVYKWTHIPTLKWYVGARYSKKAHPTDDYICSSIKVKPLIENNPTEWIKTIIATGNPDDMVELEAKILKLFDAKNDPRSYNQHNGDGRFKSKGPMSEASRKKLSLALKGRPNTWTKTGPDNPNYGKRGLFKHTEEHKQWNSERQRGEKNHMFGRRGKDSPHFGKKLSEQTKQKLRDNFKTVPLRCSCFLCRKEINVGTLHSHIGSRFCSGYERPKLSCRFCKLEMWASTRHNHFRLNRCPALPGYGTTTVVEKPLLEE